MSFEALRGELEQLQKAIPQDAAATPAAVAVGTGTGDDRDDADPTDAGEVLGKSFSFQLADGTTIDAVDGTELVKAFGERLVGTETDLKKAIEDIGGLLSLQTALIKSQAAELAQLKSGGAGRRSVLSVREAVSPANSVAPLLKSHGYATGKDAMDAAEAAYKGGRISATELSMCEGFMGKSLPFPAALAAKVSAA